MSVPLNPINCRARVSVKCMHEKPMIVQLGYEGVMADDGTYDGESIVCDACYVALMPFTPSTRALNHEVQGEALQQAISLFNEARQRASSQSGKGVIG